MISADPPATRQSRRDMVRVALGRGALLLAGLALAAWLVGAAGYRAVWHVLEPAGRWLPVVVLCEVLLILLDVAAIRVLLGEAARAVAFRTWLRSTTLAYTSMVFLPAGRATGEIVRAATLAPDVGAARASGACTRLQACALAGGTVISAVGALVVALHWGVRSILVLGLIANGLGCGLMAATLFALVRSQRFATWLRRKMRWFVDKHAPSIHLPPPARAEVAGVLLSSFGRVIQVLQYGVILHAVGGVASFTLALTAQGIHLVGAAIGDAIPNQMGATEGVYRAFASQLGFATEPARALSIALLARVAQIGIAVACLLVGTLVGRQPTIEARP